jgi:hypothetical protein
MEYLIAGVLLGAAAIILTLPWSRRDPADFSLVEFGYAWRGPRGAVVGALNVLTELGAVVRSRRRGAVRIDTSLPRDIGPLAKAVYAGLVTPRGPNELRDLKNVKAALPAVAARVRGAGLRAGPARRVLGGLAALASPVVALVELFRTGDVAVGLPVTFVAVVGAGWLLLLRGITIAGMRTMTRPDESNTTPREQLSLASGSISAFLFPINPPDSGYPPSVGDSGGGDSGGGGGD